MVSAPVVGGGCNAPKNSTSTISNFNAKEPIEFFAFSLQSYDTLDAANKKTRIDGATRVECGAAGLAVAGSREVNAQLVNQVLTLLISSAA